MSPIFRGPPGNCLVAHWANTFLTVSHSYPPHQQYWNIVCTVQEIECRSASSVSSLSACYSTVGRWPPQPPPLNLILSDPHSDLSSLFNLIPPSTLWLPLVDSLEYHFVVILANLLFCTLFHVQLIWFSDLLLYEWPLCY